MNTNSKDTLYARKKIIKNVNDMQEKILIVELINTLMVTIKQI